MNKRAAKDVFKLKTVSTSLEDHALWDKIARHYMQPAVGPRILVRPCPSRARFRLKAGIASALMLVFWTPWTILIGGFLLDSVHDLFTGNYAGYLVNDQPAEGMFPVVVMCVALGVWMLGILMEVWFQTRLLWLALNGE